ncbi:response regulator receiver protein [Lentinula detonsa]|uniref:Transcription factor n=1 Tax=Lentinula detonsa TaxID=2804962 RepID=A0A9W8P3Z9_9AGAR|nr:response regulator receiver protein [Lentinula detonsa]KAJ3983028.1 response regulator receiver protein [Lentinula detonsa]
MFKHSNFASFVRQLNKYDFHKVKNTDDNAFGEHSWTFRHPNFHADRRDALENIKRKVPASRKSQGAQNAASTTRPMGSSGSSGMPLAIDRLTASHDELSSHIRSLERNIGINASRHSKLAVQVLIEVVRFQQNMAQQDSVMQGLIDWVLHGGGTGGEGSSYRSSYGEDRNNSTSMGTTGINDSVGRAALMKMNEISRRVGDALNANGNNVSVTGDHAFGSGDGVGDRPPSRFTVSNPDVWNGGANVVPTKITSRRDALAKIEELQRMRPASADTSIEEVVPTVANARQEQEQRSQEMESNNSEPWNMMLPNVPPLGSFGSQEDLPSSQSQREQPPLSMLNPFPDYTSNHEGLQVYTVGHLMPKSAIDDMSGTWSFDPGMFGGNEFDLSGNASVGGQERKADGGSPMLASLSQVLDPSSSSSTPSTGPDSGSKKLRVRRTAFVPGWAVSPRVLLVDDDAVSRKLGSKFLQVFGCKIDVAVDGVSAVNKMNLEKYDLVLMDIVMPKLDGVSATSLIRKFDHMTPIISMTSNSKPNEIMTYYHSGMNDILPKPFTKQGLLDMLEKHLMHLKVIQQMSRVPRSLGIPPLSDSGFEEAITSQAALLTRQNAGASTSNTNELSGSNGALSLSSSTDMQPSYSFNTLGANVDDDDMGRINPLAGMGLSDEQYNAILTGIVNGETFSGSIDMGGYSNEIGGLRTDTQKRRLDDQEDGREGKRSRFEVLE